MERQPSPAASLQAETQEANTPEAPPESPAEAPTVEPTEAPSEVPTVSEAPTEALTEAPTLAGGEDSAGLLYEWVDPRSASSGAGPNPQDADDADCLKVYSILSSCNAASTSTDAGGE